MDSQALYAQLGRLISSVPPSLKEPGVYDKDTLMWLARAYALVEQHRDVVDIVDFKTNMNIATNNTIDMYLGYRTEAVNKLFGVIYRHLAMAELKAPSAAQGAFIPAGNAFDAMAAFAAVANKASTDLLIIDPYMDEKTLTDFAPTAREKVSLRLLADTQHVKPTLKPAIERWSKQYGATRPLSARLTPARSLHDRLMIVDKVDIWVITQSLNAIADRSPAAIVRVEGDTRNDKLAAYEAIWSAATPL